MKAAVRSKYGLPGVLTVQEVEKPTPKDDEILIRVHAATVSRTDCHVLWGLPYFMRLFTGVFRPKLATTGTDFAGEIEATGKDVKFFKVGDKVMGFEFFGLKSHAEYVSLPETKDIVAMSDDITYQEAVACVEGVFYALNVIRQMKPGVGQNALVYGATGAIGSAIVQFFRFYGTSVTAVCRGEHRELVKSWGVDKIIDYTAEDFTKDKTRYDFVFDAVGKSTFGKCKVLLKEKGLYASSGGPNLFWVLITPLLGGRKFIFAPPKDLKGCLSFVKGLIEEGRFKPVIDRTYPLDKIGDAFTYVATGMKVGNVIIKMD